MGWSRPTLDKRLKVDPTFPVVSRGDQSGGWGFELAAVRAYLNGGAKAPAKTAPAIDRAQLRDVVAPARAKPAAQRAPERRSAHHAGEATARQRLDESCARKLEREEAVAAGLYVAAADTRQKLSAVMLSLAHDLDALPEKIAKALELRDDAVPGIRAMIDKVRGDMADRAEPLLK